MGRLSSLIAVATAAFTPAFAATSSASTVKVRDDARYGKVLVDGKGRVLYLFTKEAKSTSRCYGDCATAWPPFLTRGKVRAGAGANGQLVGTTKRKNGKRQVTYNGHPVYYYITDKRPGEITCQDVFEFGGTWLLVAPAGNAIR